MVETWNLPTAIPSAHALHPFVNISVTFKGTRGSKLELSCTPDDFDVVHVKGKSFCNGHFPDGSGGYPLKDGLEGLDCRDGAPLLSEFFPLAI
jgi:hypothetical protein